MDKIQQSLEEVKQTTGKLKRLCDLESELYKDSDVFSSQIKKKTNKIQRGQVNKWFDELDRFENEYKEQLTQLKELQTVANKNIEDAVASFEKIQEAYDTAKVSLNQTKVGSLQGLARDKFNKKDIHPEDTQAIGAVSLFDIDDTQKPTQGKGGATGKRRPQCNKKHRTQKKGYKHRQK